MSNNYLQVKRHLPIATLEHLQKLGKTYDLTIVQVDDKVLADIGMYPEYFLENSALCGTTIYLGFFKEEDEKRTASFFPEIGHFLTREQDLYNFANETHLQMRFEMMAWLLGLREASLCNIYFSANTLAWAVDKVLTYRDDDDDK